MILEIDSIKTKTNNLLLINDTIIRNQNNNKKQVQIKQLNKLTFNWKHNHCEEKNNSKTTQQNQLHTHKHIHTSPHTGTDPC